MLVPLRKKFGIIFASLDEPLGVFNVSVSLFHEEQD